MTQREFTQRTLVEVSAEEFNAIHVVYMSCDLDKDEFCKVWCKMNKTRVQAAKDGRKQANERYNRCTKLMAIMQWLDQLICEGKTQEEWYDEMIGRQWSVLENENIYASKYGRIKDAYTLRNEIRITINEIASIA